MAHASTTEAPSKKESKMGDAEQAFLDLVLDPYKKYRFNLSFESPERELPVIDMVTKRPAPHEKYKPSQNIVFTSQIVWNGSRRNIRYYDGCTTLFTDDQPKEKDTIDQLVRQTKKRWFSKGEFYAYGTDEWLVKYMMITSWNGESPFKTRTSDTCFVPINTDRLVSSEEAKLDLGDRARDLAKGANYTKMRSHSLYLGLPLEDLDNDGKEISEKEMRLQYRKEALRDPKGFIESYGDEKTETKYQINDLISKGAIRSNVTPGKATWGKKNGVICDVSGAESPTAVADRIFDFSQTEDGAEFLIQLKSLYDN